jgi:hypothetical protein
MDQRGVQELIVQKPNHVFRKRTPAPLPARKQQNLTNKVREARNEGIVNSQGLSSNFAIDLAPGLPA